MLAIDWGTSSLRAYNLDQAGTVLEMRHGPHGILKIENGAFSRQLEAIAGDWLDADNVTIVMSGMIGSRQGWKEAAYVACPAGEANIASMSCEVAWADQNNRRRTARIIPGLRVSDSSGHHDVMRGEETQIFGIMDELGNGEHCVCLPGTHSKWVTIRNQNIVDFSTYMTGEVFAVMKQHSILGRTMRESPASDSDFDEGAFRLGVTRAGEGGGLLHHLFGVRTDVLLGELPDTHATAFLSGILIGHELSSVNASRGQIHLVGSKQLTKTYALAAAQMGVESVVHDEHAVARGLFKLAQFLPD